MDLLLKDVPVLLTRLDGHPTAIIPMHVQIVDTIVERADPTKVMGSVIRMVDGQEYEVRELVPDALGKLFPTWMTRSKSRIYGK